MSENEEHWKLIYTRSRQEKKVSDWLNKYQIEHYLPLVRTLRMWSDRKKWVDMPLFNGYIFVNPDANQRDQILPIPGVVKFIRHNGEDAKVRPETIELIRELLEKGYNVSQVDGSEGFGPGDRAKVLDGPWKGQEVEVLESAGEAFVLVTFEHIEYTLKVRLPKEILQLTQKSGGNKSLWGHL